MLKIAHIALSVSNLDKSVGFYRKHFGLECVEKYAHKDSGFTIAILKKGDITLELFEFKSYRPLPKYRKKLENDLKTLGVKHFSLEASDITKMYQALKKAKVRFATGMSTFDTGQRYFFVKDPDGILVEIIEHNRKKTL